MVRSGLLILMLEKLNLIYLSNLNSGAIDVNTDGCLLEEKSSFNMVELSFSSKLDWPLTLPLLLKLP